MKQRIEIRSLKRTDKKELSRLLRRQEGYDEFFSEEKDADILAKAVAERRLVKNTGKILLFTAENEKEKPGSTEMSVRAGEDGKGDAGRKQDPVFEPDVFVPDAAPVSEH